MKIAILLLSISVIILYSMIAMKLSGKSENFDEDDPFIADLKYCNQYPPCKPGDSFERCNYLVQGCKQTDNTNTLNQIQSCLRTRAMGEPSASMTQFDIDDCVNYE
jgi:hypothetical protein